jgi:predicted P-loop ATPase/GTPase
LSTAKLPHTHYTSSVPTYGAAESRFVITVAPQNDICPHGKTYPRKAVAIVTKKINTPIDHV